MERKGKRKKKEKNGVVDKIEKTKEEPKKRIERRGRILKV
jgi:hypothetical protein